MNTSRMTRVLPLLLVITVGSTSHELVVSAAAAPAGSPPGSDSASKAPTAGTPAPRPAPPATKAPVARPAPARPTSKATEAPVAPPRRAPRARKAAKKKMSFSERLEAVRRFLRGMLRLRLEALWFLHYRYGYGRTPDKRLADYNAFTVSRGYFGMSLKPTRWFEARITSDTSQDDLGDWKVRLKYLYGKFILPVETAVVTDPYVQVGLVPMPWLGFEEHINRYRVQGTMFAERQGLFNSADLGVTAGVLLGRKLSARYRKEVSDSHPGTWGSLQVGVYNGAGYHSIEKNGNKALEWRVSLRPLGWIHPNLQLTYFGVWGKGNVEQGNSIPTWHHHAVMVSYEHQYVVLTGQFMMGQGIQKGEGQLWIGLDGQPAKYKGASGFFEVKLPWIWSSLIGRYDWFDGPNESGLEPYQRFIAGWAFHFWGKNLLLLDFDYSLLGKDSLGNDVKDLWAITLSLQVKL